MSVSTPTQPDYTSQTGSAYKANIDGAIQVVLQFSGQFAPHQQTVADMTVRLDAGRTFGHSSGLEEVAAQNTGTITAPVTNPRYDIVYVDQLTGAVGVAAGSENVSPSDPAVPAGKVPIARVRLATATTAITNSLLDDLRVPNTVFEPSSGGAITPTLTDRVVLGDASASYAQGYATIEDVLALGAGIDEVARDMAAQAMALADATGAAGTKGPFHLADSCVADTLAGDATYNAAGDYYTNAPGGYGANIATTATCTASTLFGGSGPASNLNDGNTGTTARFNTGTTADIYLDFGSGNAPILTQYGLNAGANDPSTWTQVLLKGSATGAWAGEEVTIDTWNFSGLTNNSEVTRAVTNSTGYRYYWFDMAHSSSTPDMREITAYEDAAIVDVTISPAAAETLETADPADVLGYFRFERTDATLVPSTDLPITFSIDGGTTDATATWRLVGVEGGYELWAAEADVSAQTGDELTYEIASANTKAFRLKQVVGLVPLY